MAALIGPAPSVGIRIHLLFDPIDELCVFTPIIVILYRLVTWRIVLEVGNDAQVEVLLLPVNITLIQWPIKLARNLTPLLITPQSVKLNDIPKFVPPVRTVVCDTAPQPRIKQFLTRRTLHFLNTLPLTLSGESNVVVLRRAVTACLLLGATKTP